MDTIEPVRIGDDGREPWSGEPGAEGAVRGRLRVLSNRPGAPLHVWTSSDRILRDLDLLVAIHARGEVRVTLRVPTADRRLARVLEPWSPSPAVRLAALTRLRAAGIEAGVEIGPILPGITDRLGALRRVVRAAARAGAQWIHGAVLRLPPEDRRGFYSFLREFRPALLERYRRAYGVGANPPADYESRVLAMIDALRRDTPISDPGRASRSRDLQLLLPFAGAVAG